MIREGMDCIFKSPESGQSGPDYIVCLVPSLVVVRMNDMRGLGGNGDMLCAPVCQWN